MLTTRVLAAVFSFITLVFAKFQGCFRFGRLKQRISQLSLRTLSAQALSLTLILSILTTSVPAAPPTAFFASASEFGQDVRYAYLNNFTGSFLGANFSLSSFAELITTVNPILGFLTGKKANKKQDRPAVARIEISPNTAVIREGEQLAFAGLGYDSQNNLVQGAAFTWRAVDSRKKSPPLVLQNGVFEPQFPGTFIVTAESGGVSREAQITVVKDTQMRALKEVDERIKAEKDPNKANKQKVLPEEVAELMKQPLPAPVHNSTRMTDTRELQNWDRENKQRKAPQFKRSAPAAQQQRQSSKVIQSDDRGTADREESAVAINRQRREGRKGGPRADEDETPADEEEVPVKPIGGGGDVVPEKEIAVTKESNNASESASLNKTSSAAQSAAAAAVVAPNGVIDNINNFGRIRGWAFDPADGNASILVHFYIDGPAGQGTIIGYTRANQYRPDVNQAYGISGNHGYEFIIPSRYFDGQQHTIYAYGIGLAANNNSLLGNSPTYFNLYPGGNPHWNNSNFTSADDPTSQPGNPSNIGTDGPGSGNFSFSAPVISLDGRGDLGTGLSLNYNSLLWHRANGQITYDIDKGYPAKGWTLGFGKMMDMDSMGGAMIEGGDGTRHSYDGTFQGGYGGGYSTFYGRTTDGSFIDYTVQSTPYGLYSGTAHFPNGTVIQYGANYNNAIYPTHIKDRHGNYMTISYVDNIGPNIHTITDNLGRVIQFHYDSANRLVSITGPAQGSGTRTLVRIHYRSLHLDYAFSQHTPLVQDADVDVVDAIYYPDLNTGYWFGDGDSYSSYGMLTKVREARGMSWSGSGNNDQGTVSGGTMTREVFYHYPMSPAAGALPGAPQYTQTTETWHGMDTGPAVTTYNIQSSGTPRMTSITLPSTTNNGVTTAGNIVKQYSYNAPGQWNDGLLYQVETVSPSNQVLSKSVTSWEQGDYNSVRPTEVQSTDEKNQTTKQTISYGSNPLNQVAETLQYGYSNNLLRKTVYGYENGDNYRGYYYNGRWSSGRHIFSLVKTEELYDANNIRVSKTDYSYDGATLMNTPGVIMYEQTSNPHTTETVQGGCVAWDSYWVEDDPYNNIGHWEYYCTQYEQVQNFDSSTLARGNVTQTTSFAHADNATGGVTHNSTYDITGNARTVTTDCCQQMSFDYAQTFQYAYSHSMTKGSSDPNSPDRMTQGMWYDYNTGLQTSATDFNGRITWFHYDAVNRPWLIVFPTGGKKQLYYNDGANSSAESVREANDTVASYTESFMNGRGQIKFARTFMRNSPNFWDDSNFSNVQSVYDQAGRKSKESLPYTTGGPSHWTVYAYDSLSRVTQVMAPDGSTTKSFYNLEGAATVAGQTVKTQDVWGRERWARTDDFGRLVEVIEPDPNSTGGVNYIGTLKTQYTYNAKDELVQVNQGAQERKFWYDGLGRLIRQKLAEQNGSLTYNGQFVGGNGGGWSEVFEYDSRSNLTKRIDARGVKTNYHYNNDPLNRLQSVTHDKSGADQTYPIQDVAPVTIEYMTAGDKTRVRKVGSAWGWTEENGYDVEGRIAEYKVWSSLRPNEPMTTNYLYDTVSRLTEIRYPNQWGTGTPRKIVNVNYDEASRLKELKVDQQIQMSEIAYNPMSQVTQLKTAAATNNADVETYEYEQTTGLLTKQKVFKANNPTQQLLNLEYYYERRGDSKGTLNGKTGQLTAIVDNKNRDRDRLYEYDAMGRLAKAKAGIATGFQMPVTANWTQSYAYDRYGNRTGVAASGITANNQAVPRDGLDNQSYDQSSNRITTSGYQYDLAGNLVKGQKPDGTWQRYEYDAAGRLLLVRNDATGAIEYGNGYTSSRQRISSFSDATPGVFTIYAWGGSSIIAEYTTSSSNGQSTSHWKKSYIYAGSRLLSTYTKNNQQGGETQEFHHPDRLGTKLVTNNAANTSFEQSTLPFGTALDAESTGSTNQRFTSYDRSNVASLDYAVNRSYLSAQGRFTSVDPIGMSATSLTNPQSLNLYAYVENDPINSVDPSGLFTQGPGNVVGVVTVPWGDDDRIAWTAGFLMFLIHSREMMALPSYEGGEVGGGGDVPLPPDLRDRVVDRAGPGTRCAKAVERLIRKTAEITKKKAKKNLEIGNLYDKVNKIELDKKLPPFRGQTDDLSFRRGGNNIRVGPAPQGYNGKSIEGINESYTYVVVHELAHNGAEKGAYTDAELLRGVIAISKEDGKKSPAYTDDPNEASQSINRNYIGQHCGKFVP